MFAAGGGVLSLGRGTPAILPLRAQSDLITELVRERLETILPAAMDATGLDMWIILCQEDDPDPLYRTMIPFDNWLPILSGLVFAREGERYPPLQPLDRRHQGPLRAPLFRPARGEAMVGPR